MLGNIDRDSFMEWLRQVDRLEEYSDGYLRINGYFMSFEYLTALELVSDMVDEYKEVHTLPRCRWFDVQVNIPYYETEAYKRYLLSEDDGYYCRFPKNR